MRINQTIDPAFSNTHQIGYRDRGVVERHGERCAMKVPTRQNFTRCREHERIVSATPGFNFYNLANMIQRSPHRTVNLWHAAQTVSVLHSRIVIQMRSSYFTVAHQLTQVGTNSDLAGMRPGLLNPFIESHWSAAQCFKAHRPGSISDHRYSFRSQQRKASYCAHSLSSVEKGKSFLCFQCHRSDAGPAQSIAT